MNFKHLLGKAAADVVDAVLASQGFPLFRRFASGIRWEYDLSRYAGTRDLDVLFDVGANIGQTVHRLRRYFPGSTIYSFEPVRETFERLTSECRRYRNVHLFRAAMGASEETREIILQEHCELNSLRFGQGAGGTGTAESIEVQTVDNFCVRHRIERIDLLKTDAQGYDLEVLVGARNLISSRKVSFVLAEVSFQPDDATNQLFAPVHAYLGEHGYRLAGIYDQNNYGPRLMVLGCANALYVHPEAVK
jgi:FkbM family methyltransferase